MTNKTTLSAIAIVLITFFIGYFFFRPVSWEQLWLNQDQLGAKLLKAGKPDESAEAFKNQDWRGVAYYRAGEYEEAADLFVEGQTADGFYNYGNALAYQKNFQGAIEAYNKTLELDEHHEDAKYNKQLLEELLKQMQKQQQKYNNNSKDKKKDKQNKQKSNQKKREDDDRNKKNQKKKPKNKNQQQEGEKYIQQDKKEQSKNQKIMQDKEQQQAKKEQVKRDSVLRQIDDDPGGLLKRKFLRDFHKRQRERAGDSQ